MFTACDITFRSIDLDSAAYQENDWGGQVRTALNARYDIKTIPQIFIGGRHIGGATETFDAFNRGDLQAILSSSSVVYNRETSVDPYSLLPTWLHPR